MRNTGTGMGFRHELELTENVYNTLASQVKQDCQNCNNNLCLLESCEIFRQKVESLTYVN
ncbi:hypothetical protein M0P65_04530 [Candidatus Gracilibacteria bacterium]|jgi:hypothetical protein|nr:hypothetical protein [Candidatus Gracilibacteria bacterium]